MKYSGMRPRRLVLLSVGSAVALFALTGCGGSDKKADPTATATSGGASSPSASAPASAPGSASASASLTASVSASASATRTSTPGGGNVTGSGAEALKALAKDLSGKTYRVAYEISIKSSTGTTKGDLTLAQKPPHSLTVFNITEPADAREVITLIDDGKTTLNCVGDATGGGACIKTKSGGSNSLFGSIVSVDAILRSLEGAVDVTEAGGETIAGAESRCFKVTEPDGSKGVACFTKKDGLLTSLQSKDDGDGSETSLRATSVASSVPDSAFDPPKDYSVTDKSGG